MAGELPFFLDGKVVEFLDSNQLALVKVINGNIYHILPTTEGLEFSKLKLGSIVRLEVTTRLTRVLSATIVSIAGECDGSTKGS